MLDANKILQMYKDKNYAFDVGERYYNISYIEGLNPDGTSNSHISNHWDDLRVVWQALPDGTARVVGAWEATTRAGKYFEILHPMQAEGAFHIALGPQTVWTMGQYHDQTALKQVLDITGTRDVHRNYLRDGPTLTGLFGIHHHWGYNYPHDDLGRSSAGCQVGRLKDGHNEFIAILKQDIRYQRNNQFVWTSTVFEAKDYENAGVEKEPPVSVKEGAAKAYSAEI
jgi:hypothetical protein